MGYPDCGNGFYSDKLDYKHWFDFNSKQRAYKNCLESLAPTLCFLLIGGLEVPWVAISAAILYLSGRLIYFIGYIRNPKSRAPGFMVALMAMQLMLVMAIYAIGRMLYDMN